MKSCLLFFLLIIVKFENFAQSYSCDIRYLNKSFQYSIIQSNYEKDIVIENIIQEITTAVGLQPNFVSKNFVNFNNCAAININGFRYIIYDDIFLNDISKNGNKKAIVTSILAHEIGHHLQGHTTNNTNFKDSKFNELEADKFSGYISAKLGYTIDDAISFINAINSDENSLTHPPKRERINAVRIGFELWEKAVNEIIVKEKLSIIDTISNKSMDYFIEAEQLRNEKKYNEAIIKLYKSYELNENPIILLAIAQCHFDLEDYSKAINLLTNIEQSESLNNNIKKDLVLYNLGYANYKLSNFEKSIYYFKKVLLIDKYDIIAKERLASSYYYNNEIDKSYEIYNEVSFDKSIEQSGYQDFTIGDIYLQKGIVLGKNNMKLNAIKYFKKADSLFYKGHPNKLLCTFYLGSSYIDLNQLENGSKELHLFIDEFKNQNVKLKSFLISYYKKASFTLSNLYRQEFAQSAQNGGEPNLELLRKSSSYLIDILSEDENDADAYLGVGVNWIYFSSMKKDACDCFKKSCDLGLSKGCEFYKTGECSDK